MDASPGATLAAEDLICRSIIETRGMPVCDALKVEWANGLDVIRREGTAGATRFRDGAGRHGDFSNI
ncbi:hypothetical protein [Ruegeria sp. HKCCSP346]|uniref:hypothetical protein n=1 Tax=Ruegeria sp. HKCCSP346 TaxID=2794830 RepID=UPI001AE242AC|nr:hypothetical protein [Ruegeria sp. HKCCSP346]